MVAVLALHAVPVEWRMNMKTGVVTSRQLDDRLGEFPAINLDYAAQKNRWSYQVSLARGDKLKFDGLYKYDLASGACQTHRFAAGVFGSEPGFAPRIGARDEDDGYVVTFVTDENSGKSEVQVIAAKQFEAGPIARVQLPVRVPLGFHATWMRGDQMAKA
jgi:carotenoid cleavage dioxygenase